MLYFFSDEYDVQSVQLVARLHNRYGNLHFVDIRGGRSRGIAVAAADEPIGAACKLSDARGAGTRATKPRDGGADLSRCERIYLGGGDSFGFGGARSKRAPSGDCDRRGDRGDRVWGSRPGGGCGGRAGDRV